MEQKLNIQLSLDEANTILEALGHMPYQRVYRIVESIQQQAAQQLQPQNGLARAAENGANTNGKKAAVAG